MKNLVIFMATLACMVSAATASDYIIAKKGENVLVLIKSETDPNDFTLITCGNPKIIKLESHELPASFENVLKNPDGVYDSRLEEVTKTHKKMTTITLVILVLVLLSMILGRKLIKLNYEIKMKPLKKHPYFNQ